MRPAGRVIAHWGMHTANLSNLRIDFRVIHWPVRVEGQHPIQFQLFQPDDGPGILNYFVGKQRTKAA